MSIATDILRNYDSLRFERINHDHIIQDIIDYIVPFYQDIIRLRSPGFRRTAKIFDTTATYGSFILSQFIQGAICNSATRWFGLSHREQEMNDDPEVATTLKRWTDTMLLAFRNSNFYQGNGQAINSWINFGNAPLLCEMVPQTRENLAQLRFTSLPFGQYVMAEGPDGKIDTVIRKVTMPAINALKMFKADGQFNYGLTPEVEKMAEKNPYYKVDFLHAIQPRENIGYSNKSKIKNARELAWSSCWVLMTQGNKLVRESGYRLFPVAIARYDLISGETYARGPSEMALPDARTMNEADRKEMLMWDRQLDPPTLSRRNSIINGVLNKRAGGDTVVSDVNTAVRQLFDQPNWQADDMMRKRKEQAILRIYHVNEILNLLSREKPELTAFETNARLNLLQQIQGPVYSRLEQDYQAVIINVTLDNLAHAGMLEQPPEVMMQGEIKGILNVNFESPLARAQRNQEIADIQQSIADVGGIQQFAPEILQMLDFQKITRKLFEIRNTLDMMVTPQEFKQRMAQMQQQQQAQQQMGVAAGAAQAAGQVAPFIKAVREGVAPGGQAAA